MASGECTNRYDNNSGSRDMNVVRLRCWMPDGFAVIEHRGSNDDENEEAFIEDNCRGCDYYFEEEDADCSNYPTDDNGNSIICGTVQSQCPCYRCGLPDVSWPCAAGYDEPTWGNGDDEIVLSPMVFRIDLRPELRWLVHATGAHCQKAERTADGWRIGGQYEAGNVHASGDICWGDNSAPLSLAEAVATYGDAPGNSDLLKPYEFESSRRAVRRSHADGMPPGVVIGGGYDAMLVCTAAHDPAAYLLLRCSGAPADGGLIVLGLTRCSHEIDGELVAGYLTDPIINGRSWLVIDHPERLEEGGEGYDQLGLLLGQIQSASQIPCSSPAPSSSALAAVAAS